ncbi:MAG TPA: Ig-like domain-containing protein [Polyangiaceae bacterium]
MARASSSAWLFVTLSLGCGSSELADGNGEGSAGAGGADDETHPVLVDDRGVTARGFTVDMPVLRNDRRVDPAASVILLEAPRHGTALVNDGLSIEYVPGEGFVGVDGLSYRLSGVDHDQTAHVSIEVLDREWLLLGAAAFEVERGPEPDFQREPLAAHWVFSDVSATHVVGHAGPEGRERAFLWPIGRSAPIWLTENESRAHHVSEAGIVSGALGPPLGGQGVLWRDGEGERFSAPWAAWTELFAVSRGAAIGSASDGERTLPVRFRSHSEVDVLELPEGFDQGRALGANDAGTIVGAVLDGDAELAYVHGDGTPTLLPLGEAVWSRAHDIDERGTIVGALRAEGAFPRGFVYAGGTAKSVELHEAIATELLGVGNGDELAGALLDPSGYRWSFIARSNAALLAEGSRVRRAADAPNSGVSHACIHSTEGPFRVLNGAGASSPPAFDEPHTRYTLLLARAAETRFLYRAAGPEQVSLFVYPPGALRLHAPDGALIRPQLVRASSLCPRIEFIYQFEISEAGEHALVVDENPRTTLYVILERSWSY